MKVGEDKVITDVQCVRHCDSPSIHQAALCIKDFGAQTTAHTDE